VLIMLHFRQSIAPELWTHCLFSEKEYQRFRNDFGLYLKGGAPASGTYIGRRCQSNSQYTPLEEIAIDFTTIIFKNVKTADGDFSHS
jgi:hypothetical protein